MAAVVWTSGTSLSSPTEAVQTGAACSQTGPTPEEVSEVQRGQVTCSGTPRFWYPSHSPSTLFTHTDLHTHWSLHTRLTSFLHTPLLRQGQKLLKPWAGPWQVPPFVFNHPRKQRPRAGAHLPTCPLRPGAAWRGEQPRVGTVFLGNPNLCPPGGALPAASYLLPSRPACRDRAAVPRKQLRPSQVTPSLPQR